MHRQFTSFLSSPIFGQVSHQLSCCAEQNVCWCRIAHCALPNASHSKSEECVKHHSSSLGSFVIMLCTHGFGKMLSSGKNYPTHIPEEPARSSNSATVRTTNAPVSRRQWSNRLFIGYFTPDPTKSVRRKDQKKKSYQMRQLCTHRGTALELTCEL